jgi:crotonobetainyl-CoA:carnitine CoA-transferase CaiB-like acyl-CoA transferase
MSVELLRGIRVIDLSMGWAGPLAGRHLADNGAEVIKVESCRHFDWWRGWEATQAFIDDNGAEKSAAFNMVNRNKLGITLDLMQPAGKELLKRLVAIADVVIENYSGGVLPKLGLDYAALAAVKPDLIMMSMPAFGASGGWRDYRAYGSTVEHASGLPHLNGAPEWPPTMQHVAFGDPVAGLNAAAAVLIALRYRRRTGEGQYLDLSQAECLFPLAVHGILEQSATGRAPPRLGNRSRNAVPRGVYPCRGDDEWVTIDVQQEAQWQALQRLLPGLEPFCALAERLRHVDDIDRVIADWTAGQTPEAVVRRLQAAGVPAAPLAAASRLTRDPHLEARQFWTLREREHVGPLPHPATPYRAGEAPYPIDRTAPTLGEHNRRVLGELLGLSDAAIDELSAAGIIGNRPALA